MLRYRDKSRYIDRFSVRRKHLRGRKIPSFLFFVKIADEHESNNFLLSKDAGDPPPPRFRCIISRARRRIVEFHPARKRAKEKR